MKNNTDEFFKTIIYNNEIFTDKEKMELLVGENKYNLNGDI